LEPALGHAAWATVRRLHLGPSYRDKGLEVLMHPVLRNVREVDGAGHEVVRALATSDPPWAIESLRGSLCDGSGMLPELLAPRGLPALRNVTLAGWFGAYASTQKLRSLWSSPLARQLALVRFGAYPMFVGQW